MSIMRLTPKCYPQVQYALKSIYSREWSNRVWTLQEILLTANPVLCCGTQSLPWSIFVYSTLFIEHVSLPSYLPGGLCSNWPGLLRLWLAFRQLRGESQRSNTNSTNELDKTSARGSLNCSLVFLQRSVQYYTRVMVSITVIEVVIVCGLLSLFVLLLRDSIEPETGLLTVESFSIIIIFLLPFLFFILTSPFPYLLRLLSWKKRIDKWIHGFDERVGLPEAVIQELYIRKAANPKDKFYGVYSLLQGLGFSCPPIDYSKPLAIVYRELYLTLLQFEPMNINLILLGGFAEFQHYPSWIPDWRVNENRHWLKLEDLQIRSKKQRNATPLSKPIWDLGHNRELILRGWRSGHIVWMSKSFFVLTAETYLETEKHLHLHNIDAMRDLLNQCSKQESEELNPHPLLQLLKGRKFQNREREEELFRGWIMELRNPRFKKEEDVLQSLKSKKRILDYGVEFFRSLALGEEMFCVPSWPKAVIGNCSRLASVGDILVLASGISMPLVLRPYLHGFRLIGCANISNVMNGELWKEVDLDNLEEIVLF